MNLSISIQCRPENVSDCSYITVSGMFGVTTPVGDNSLTVLPVALWTLLPFAKFLWSLKCVEKEKY